MFAVDMFFSGRSCTARTVKRGLVGFFFFATGISAQTTLFFEDFAGSNAVDLNGTAPDTRPGSETWASGTGSGAWKTDGSISAGGTSNAYLAFTPSSGHIYSLSLDANPQTVDSNWFALGFTSAVTIVDGFQAGGNSSPWMLLRGQRGSGGVQTFLGPSTGGGNSHTVGSGSINLKVVLDTSNADWTTEWLLDGIVIRTETFSGNPTINYVGFGSLGGIAGVVDNFSLTVTAVPEPAGYALAAALAATTLAAFRRRKRA